MRIGLLIDGPALPAWQCAAARALEAAGARIECILEQAPAAATDWPDPFARWAWRGAERLDRWLADRRPALRHAECVAPAAEAPAQARRARLPAAGEARIAAAREALAGIDLLVDLDSARGPLPAEALPEGCAQWRLARSGYELAAGAPRGFWEAARDDDTIEISVADMRDGRVLRRRVLGADRLSWTLQRRLASTLAPAMLADALADALRAGARAATPAPDAAGLPEFDARPRLGAPGSLEIARAALRTLRYVAGELWMRARGLEEQWFVLLGRGEGGRYRLRDFETLEPPPDRIWADPFPIEETGPDGTTRVSVLVEDMHVAARRGAIALLRREPDGWQATTVIEAPHHLSYPYLFDWQGQRYLVPESGQGGEIACYRMGADATQWTPEAPLMRGVRAVDTSLVAHEGRVWMFTGLRRGDDDVGARYGELHLFHAERFPTDDWTPHPANPVVCDARVARMGGGFLRRGDALYRVAQGARAGVYGTHVELRRILRLDPQAYAEEAAASVHPDWAPMLNGTHHLAALGDVLAIDARRLRKKP